MTPMTTSSSDLPAHQAAVARAVFEDLADEPRVSGTRVQELSGELQGRLAPLAARPGQMALGAVRIDRHVLARALACPASAMWPPFAWNAQVAARRLGLCALRAAVTGNASVPDCVRRAVCGEIEQPTNLGAWLAELDAPRMAGVVTVASSWAARAKVSVPWSTFAHWSLRADALRLWPLGVAGPIRIEGRTDATVRVRGSAMSERVVVNFGRPDPIAQRLDALTASLVVKRAPLRCVTVEPASGHIARLDVDEALLAKAIDDVVRAAGALGAEPKEERPGPLCWHCHRGAACSTGTQWRSQQERRVNGIPVAHSSDKRSHPRGGGARRQNCSGT